MAKKVPGINGGSMSDISFLLLTFFLLTSSIDTDLGIARRLPPPLPPNAEKPKIKDRNVHKVSLNFNDGLFVNGQHMPIEELREATKIFLSNPYDDPNKSEQVMKEFPLLGSVRTSKGVISLQNDNGTSYDIYIRVQNELTAAINELRDALAKERFGLKYNDLNDPQAQAVASAIPVAISEAEPKDYGGKK